MFNVYAIMEGVEKYVVSGAVAGLKNVVWEEGGTGAFTDGVSIHLPRLDALCTGEELVLWQYYAEHELGHEDAINSSPHWREVMLKNKNNPKYKDDGLLWKIVNLISDHVQERNRVGIMPGRDRTLLEGRGIFLRRQFKEELPADLPECDAALAACFLWDTEERGKVNPHITPPVYTTGGNVEEYFKLVAGCGVDLLAVKDEGDVFTAGVKVRSLFTSIPEKNSGEGDGKEEGSGDSATSGEGKGEEKKKTGKKFTGKVPGEHKPASPHKAGKEESAVRTKKHGGSMTPRIPKTLKSSNMAERWHGAMAPLVVTSAADSFMSGVAPLIHRSTLPAKTRAYLMGQRRVKETTGYRSGRLDTGRLSDVLRNREDVFRRKESTRMVDSAVSVLVDCSGSMSGWDKYTTACASAVMLCEALGGVGVSLEVAGFTEYSHDDLIHEVWLPFGRRFNKQDMLAQMGVMNACKHSNSDGENLLYAYNRLKKQKESRKILIVVSDGEPSGFGPATATMECGTFLEEVSKMIEGDKAVQLYAIGIGGHSPADYYKHYSVVGAGEKIEPTLLDVVKKGVLK